MIHRFIHDFDIKSIIRDQLLEQLTDGDAQKIKDAERSALGQIRTKIGQRYDLAKAFLQITEWDQAKQYNEDEYVYLEYTEDDKNYGVIFRAKEANTNKSPESNENQWEKQDPRDKVLVMYATDMTLYHLHARINPRSVPEIRKERYAEAIATLDMVREGEEHLDIPITEDSRDEIRHGFSGGEKKDWYW